MSTTEKNATTEEWDKRKPIKSRLLIKRRSGTREETVDSGNTVSKTTLNQIEEGRAFSHSSANESKISASSYENNSQRSSGSNSSQNSLGMASTVFKNDEDSSSIDFSSRGKVD